MRLRGHDGQSIELRLVGYEFPEATASADSKWRVVAGRVDHPRGSWTFQHPSLETDDVFRLAGWLESVMRGNQERDEEGFTWARSYVRGEDDRSRGGGPLAPGSTRTVAISSRAVAMCNVC
jgi:hypothetical protein